MSAEKNTSELRQGVGRDTVRVIMKCRRHIFARLFSNVGSDNTRQELDDGHDHMRSMLEVMERVVAVH
jgi:hypothetical protein